MSAADPRLLVATELLEEHLPESVCESGCALRCGYHGDNIALHLAEAVLAAADAADPLRAEAVPRCTSTESGGVRCELPAGHQPPRGALDQPRDHQCAPLPPRNPDRTPILHRTEHQAMSRRPVVSVSSVVYHCDAAKCYATFRADVPGSKRDFPTVANKHADAAAHRAGWFLVNGEQTADCRCPEHRAAA